MVRTPLWRCARWRGRGAGWTADREREKSRKREPSERKREREPGRRLAFSVVPGLLVIALLFACEAACSTPCCKGSISLSGTLPRAVFAGEVWPARCLPSVNVGRPESAPPMTCLPVAGRPVARLLRRRLRRLLLEGETAATGAGRRVGWPAGDRVSPGHRIARRGALPGGAAGQPWNRRLVTGNAVTRIGKFAAFSLARVSRATSWRTIKGGAARAGGAREGHAPSVHDSGRWSAELENGRERSGQRSLVNSLQHHGEQAHD
jgi:hypothetical protein